MDADRSRRTQAVFTQAIGLPRAEREAMLIAACQGDAAMEAAVRRLLAAADRSTGFLESPALAAPAQTRRHTPDAVGNYLVVGVLGVGGMATVYEAIQENPNRRVALKVLHQSMAHTDAYQRFKYETEILGKLHHPGIAQIYEAGAAQLGQPSPSPFFAMELVPDAVPITVYADRHTLTLRDRIQMLASVCDAVHHGHQHGVIHRDLKPGNVLVDAEGRPKVIDFGVARTSEAGTEALTRSADAQQLIGTLNYMSPEQCGTDAGIDSRTDVYSLGVLLYELVCGRLPHDLSGAPLPAALHAIMHEPPRPIVFTPASADRDLEAIIMKALRKEPEARYDSASAMAGDLRRWLSHLPTEARPPGVMDQLRLFAMRNRAVVAAGVLVAASIVLVATISTAFAVRLSQEIKRRREAEQQATSERDVALWQAYTAQIAGALSAMKTGEFQQMRTRLSGASENRRGWEWGFLNRLAERSLSTAAAHEDMVLDMAVNRDFSRIATAAADGSIRLWNGEGSKLLASFESSSGSRATAVAFTDDGDTLLTGDADGNIRILEAATLADLGPLGQLSHPVRSIVELPDGRICAASASGEARLWTLEPRTETALVTDQPGGVRGVYISPDRSTLATFNDAGHIWLRDAFTLDVTHRFQFPAAAYQVAFSGDGRLLGAAGGSASLHVWSITDELLLHEIKATDGVGTVRSLAISNDGTKIAAGLIHRGIVLCSTLDGQIIGRLGGHTEAISGLRFRPDDEVLISSSWDRTLRTWRTADAAAPAGWTQLDGHTRNVRAVAFSPDGSMLASVGEDGTLRLWDPELAVPIARLRPAGKSGSSIFALAFSPDGALVAAGCADNSARIWSTTTGQEVAKFVGHTAWVYSVAFDPTGMRLATGDNRGEVRVWDIRTAQELFTIPAHSARVNSVCFSPDGLTLASGSRDRQIALWDTSTREERFRGTDHELDVFAVLFSKDGCHLYSGARDQTVRIWNTATGACEKVLAGHGQYVTSLALNRDATRLAAGSWYGEIVLFDVATFDMIASFRAHDAAIRGVTFSPDGRWIASGAYDTSVRLFDSAPRPEADAAREQALAARTDAMRVLQPAFEGTPASPEALLADLRERGIDPDRDPWLRKVVLEELCRERSP